MGNVRNTIDINGKRYDATSGELIEFVAAKPAGAPKAPATANTQFVDGFVRASQAVNVSTVTAETTGTPKKARSKATHAAPHKPEPAKTLMRASVKKPNIVAPARLRAQQRTDILARMPTQTIVPKASHSTVNPKRLKKAIQVVQSPAVSRYHTPSPLAAGTVVSPFVTKTPSTPTVTSTRHATATTPGSAYIPVNTTPNYAVQSPATSPDIFEQALSRATSHEQTFDARNLPKKSKRLPALMTTMMSLLLVAGIVTYLNAPVLSVKLASSRAGFSAKLPTYSPAGYALGELSYGPGNITVSYNAGDNGDKKFDITQRVSNWDSQTLLTNFVTGVGNAYQTYERAGRTIYFYGDNTATWVKDGVWYTISGNNSLSKNQLLDLAGSM